MTSRQYKWQLKQRSLGKCIKCAKDAVRSSRNPNKITDLCDYHRQQNLDRVNRANQRKREERK